MDPRWVPTSDLEAGRQQSLGLKIGCCVDWTGLMILIKGRPERCRVRASGCAEFVLVEIGVIQILIVEILLLSPDAPSSVGQSSEQ